MAFGMKTTTGDFLPIAKYDARAGKFFKVDKRVDGGSDATEIALGTKFAIDFGSFEAGYVSFGPQGPVRHMQPYIEGQPMPAQPQEKDAEGKLVFRPGFYTKIAGNAIDGVREWCSNAAVLLNAMDDLYQTFIRAPEAAQGQIPIVCIASTVAVKSGTGARSSTNYAPVLRIEGWTARPDVLGPRSVPAPAASSPHMTAQVAQTMAAASAQPAAQPVQQPVPATVATQPAAVPVAEMPF
jgi:hypothetical protein